MDYLKNTIEAAPILAALPQKNREQATRDVPFVASLICYAFPYFSSWADGNLSLYARGADYHRVVLGYLQNECVELAREHPLHTFRAYCDVSPYPEVLCGAAAGFGVIGRNGLLLNAHFGSFLFLGVIATDARLPAQSAAVGSCTGCNRCVSLCPTGALSGGFSSARCLSSITQKRGALSKIERAQLKEAGMVWGCDLCQRCCPYNRAVEPTALSPFLDDLLYALPPEDALLSGKALERKYRGRAFIWRGGSVLKRNLGILSENGG